MIDIAGLIVKIFSEKALKNLINTVFKGNKSEVQKAYQKAFENSVDYYEFKYHDRYGVKNNRFFDYTKAEQELVKLTFVLQNPDLDMLSGIEWEHGETTPMEVISDFVNFLRYQMSNFRECEDILVQKDEYQAIMETAKQTKVTAENTGETAKHTGEMAKDLAAIKKHIVKEEARTEAKPLHWKCLFDAFKLRQLHIISIKHVGGGLLGPETLPLEDVFFEQDAGKRIFSMRQETIGRQKETENLTALFDEVTAWEGHVWRFLQEQQINPNEVQKLTGQIKKQDIQKIAAEFAKKMDEKSTIVGNRQFQQIIEQIAKRFKLKSVSVIAALSLFFTETIKRDPVLALLQAPCSAFVIGDAGVGKTTVMRMLALSLFKRFENGEKNVPLPLFVRLDKIEDYVLEKQSIDKAKNALLKYISDHWKSDVSHEADISPSAIKQCELPLQIILDGLDEIPSAQIRQKLIYVVRELIEQNCCHIIITSRPTAVDSTLIKTSQLTEIRLLELTTGQANEFVDKFFAVYNYPRSGERDSANFKSALERSDAAKQFSGNPLYLTVMILMHKKNEVLPKKRLELYAEFYQMLLLQRSSGQFKGKLADKPVFEINDEKVIKWGEAVYTPLLQWIAYLTHSNDVDSVSIEQENVIKAIKNEELQQEIKQITLDDLAQRFINFADEELGLLVSRGQFYGFSHRSLQEFLTAMHLTDYQKEPTVQHFWEKQALKKPDRWMEVARLLFCRILDKKFFQNWVRNIYDTNDPRVIRLIESIVFDLEEFFPGGGGIQSQQENLRKALSSRRDKAHGFPQMFLACGDALGQMNEPEIEAKYPLMKLLEADRLFYMGGNEESREQPIHKVKLSPFRISAYPVTNKEFAEFIKDGGYKDEKFWIDKNSHFPFDGTAFLNKLKDKQPRYWLDEEFGRKRALSPVVGVSWYEARAYCRWWNLTCGELKTGEHGLLKGMMRLPTEAEWEYACRAGTKTVFNTGENLTTDQANYDGDYPYKDFPKGKYLAKTTAVGSYPANGWGLYDMHGNVYEWCLDWYDEKFYEECQNQGVVENPVCTKEGSRRLMRGGYWHDYAIFCRSAFRDRLNLARRFSYIGFRLVFVPQSVGSSSNLPVS